MVNTLVPHVHGVQIAYVAHSEPNTTLTCAQRNERRVVNLHGSIEKQKYASD